MDTENKTTTPATPTTSPTPAPTGASTTVLTPAVPSKGVSIFIVDDDSFLLDTYALKFTKCGYTVSYATTGDEALKKLREGFTPNVLLVDNIMPGLSGLDFIAVMRKENILPHATIIMLTNQNAPGDIDVARSLKVDGYIVKAMAVPSEVVTEVEKIYAEHNTIQ